ncbi:MAG TPA: glutathione S-transferase family protein [Steroidobacteraceae bacterium]
MIKLHVFPPSPRAFKVLSVAAHLEIPHRVCMVDLSKGDQNKPEFVALNLNKRMPVLEEDGFILWEANAIVQYLAMKRPESGLLPLDERARADVTRWQFWDLAHWDAPISSIIRERVVKPVLNLGTPDPAKIAEGEQDFHRAAAVLNEHLKGRSYICQTLTVADFCIGAPLNVSGLAGLPLDDYPEIRRWHAGLMQLPGWQKALPPNPPTRAAQAGSTA